MYVRMHFGHAQGVFRLPETRVNSRSSQKRAFKDGARTIKEKCLKNDRTQRDYIGHVEALIKAIGIAINSFCF